MSVEWGKIMRGLKAYRVVDHSTTVAGAYCGKLFSDGGADVIKLESGQAGDPMRAISATGGRKEGLLTQQQLCRVCGRGIALWA